VKKTCNPSTQEAETGVPGQPGLHSEMLSQKKKKKRRRRRKKKKMKTASFLDLSDWNILDTSINDMLIFIDIYMYQHI
jgi:hypothetical protein